MWLHIPPGLRLKSVPEPGNSDEGFTAPAEWSLWCTSSGKPTLRPSSWRGWLKRPYHKLLSGTMCAPLTLARGVASWISLLAARRARISASPGSALAWMARGAGSSTSTSGSPSSVRPPSSSGRTSPGQLELFRRSALTSTSTATAAPGPSFVRVTLEPLTSALESSCWPTTRATDGTKGGPNQAGSKGDLMLPSAAVQWACKNLWPTPRASANENRTTTSAPSHGNGHGEVLAGVECDWGRENLWSTPTVHGNDNRAGLSATSGDGLQTAAKDWARSHLAQMTSPGGPGCLQYDPNSHRLCLNPAFVDWLMGWAPGWTDPRSGATDFAPAATERSPSRSLMPGGAYGSICSNNHPLEST